LRNKEN